MSSAASISPSLPRTPRQTRTRVLLLVIIIALAITAGIANAALTGRDDMRPYSPGSLQPDGAAAAAELLERVGVTVVHVQTQDDFSILSSDTTVLVTKENLLSEEDALRIRESGATTILLGSSAFADTESWGFSPNAWTSETFGMPADSLADISHSSEDLVSVSASERTCSPGFEIADDDPDGSTITPVSQVMISGDPAYSCFDSGDGSALVQSEKYSHVLYFGAAHIITNRYLDTADNAGVMLRLLGQHPIVLWVEGYASLEEGGGAPASQLPMWFLVSFAALGASGLWFGAVRGRRFGKLVAEPMPVVVPAVEANQGRARLYEAGSDAAHAARILRASFISRYSPRLGLTSYSQPDTVTNVYAAALHREEKEIAQALYTYPVRTGADLVHVATILGELEKEFINVRSR